MTSSEPLLSHTTSTNQGVAGYISSKSVKSTLGKSGNAPAGTIFQVDYEASQLDEQRNKQIVLKSCPKGIWKVKWAPQTFYELDKGSKNLLLALSDQKDRLQFYCESLARLKYGKTLKQGDDVKVRIPKKKEDLVEGKIKYIGPVEEGCPAVWFGVEIMRHYGDTDGVFKKTGVRYFTCGQGRGLFVTIKNIEPFSASSASKKETEKLVEPFKTNANSSGRSRHTTANARDSGIPQVPSVKFGDEVMVSVKLAGGGEPQRVLGKVILLHERHIAVNVHESEGSVFKPWNGYYKGKKIYSAPNKQTIWQELHEVTPSSSASATPEHTGNRNHSRNEVKKPVHPTGRMIPNQELLDQRKRLQELENNKLLQSNIAVEIKSGQKQNRDSLTSSQGQTEILKKELKEATRKLQIQDECIKELRSEVKSLNNQLQQAKRQSDEERKRLERSQKQEVERLKKELEETTKQLQMQNESLKGSSKSCSDDASLPVGMTETRDTSLEEFGKFQYFLSTCLTRDIIRDLTLVLPFSPTEAEETEDNQVKFIRLLRSKGLISPADITPLDDALLEIGQYGVLDSVRNSFQRCQSENI